MDAVSYLIEGIKLDATDNKDLIETLAEMRYEMFGDLEGFKNALDDEIKERCEDENICPHCQSDLICESFTEEIGEYFGTPVTDRVGETRCPNGCI